MRTQVQRQTSNETERKNFSDTLIEGYFMYGLYDYAYDVIADNIELISADSMRNLAQYFNNYKKDRNITGFLRAYASRSFVYPQTESDFLSLYPLKFEKYVTSVTKDNRERALLYAIMREESSFSPRAGSSAGAIGLTQLLPSTANDIADRISYKNFDLFDPKDNITLGYNYFKYLVRFVDTPFNALAAYNGGIGNLQKWQENFNSDDTIVFLDSVPFRETRNYVRKVASSAMIYAMLYFDLSSQEILEYLFK